jgi:hypothetical protein
MGHRPRDPRARGTQAGGALGIDQVIFNTAQFGYSATALERLGAALEALA